MTQSYARVHSLADPKTVSGALSLSKSQQEGDRSEWFFHPSVHRVRIGRDTVHFFSWSECVNLAWNLGTQSVPDTHSLRYISLAWDLEGVKGFLIVWSERNALADRQWTIGFTVTRTVTELSGPLLVVGCTWMPQLGYTFLVERLHWRKPYHRSFLYFQDEIVSCNRSWTCWQRSDFRSSFPRTLPRKCCFGKILWPKCQEQSVSSETLSIPSSTETWGTWLGVGHRGRFWWKTHFVRTIFIPRVIWRVTKPSPLCSPREMPLEHREGTGMFTFTVTFGSPWTPNWAVDSTHVSSLGFAFPLHGVHWRRLW